MDENEIFKGFESVWERVTAFDPMYNDIPEPEEKEKTIMIKPRESSAARRFLPYF